MRSDLFNFVSNEECIGTTTCVRVFFYILFFKSVIRYIYQILLYILHFRLNFFRVISHNTYENLRILYVYFVILTHPYKVTRVLRKIGKCIE